jgi:hypothetical protein
MSFDEQTIVYSLIKGQCMESFTADLIDRSDIVTLGKYSSALLEKIDNFLKSQEGAFISLVSNSISNKSSELIFSTESSTSYGKFIFLLTTLKVLTTYLKSDQKEIAEKLIIEIQNTLDDENFKNGLFNDQEYKNLVFEKKQIENNVDVTQTQNKTSPYYAQYLNYGVGTLILGGIGLVAFSFAKRK